MSSTPNTDSWSDWLCSWFWDAAHAEAEEGATAKTQHSLPRTDATLLADARLVLVLAPTLEGRQAGIARLRQAHARYTEFGSLTTVREFVRSTRQALTRAAPDARVQIAWSDAQLHTGLSRKLKREVQSVLTRALDRSGTQLILCGSTVRELSLLLTVAARKQKHNDAAIVQALDCNEEHASEVRQLLAKLGEPERFAEFALAQRQRAEFLLVQPGGGNSALL